MNQQIAENHDYIEKLHGNLFLMRINETSEQKLMLQQAETTLEELDANHKNLEKVFP